MARARKVMAAAAVLGAAIFASAAQAHGPVAPAASSYLAKVSRVPPGLAAQVVDGDQRMWLSVPAGLTVLVLDYRGAPYLRFSRSGVQVNQNSSMYYLNQTPVAETPPPTLTRTTPPHWTQAAGGHTYGWHDGRLHALAAIAVSPGTAYVGSWSIPVTVGGRPSAISGGVWHAQHPSVVWFWPIVVLLACVLAAWRLRRPALDLRVARVLGVTALLALALAAAGRQLHGRPTVSAWQLAELAIILAFVAWGLRRVLFEGPGYFAYFVIAFVALWQGFSLISTLFYGFVLIDLPAFIARAATVVCLASGVGILVLVYRLAGEPRAGSARTPRVEADDGPCGLRDQVATH